MLLTTLKMAGSTERTRRLESECLDVPLVARAGAGLVAIGKS